VPRTLVASPQFFAVELVRAALRHLSWLHGGRSWQAILSETSPWFESVVYFTYAQAMDLVSRYHFVPERQYCTGIWMRHDADAWSFDEAIAPENIRFCVVQSNMGLPASWTWERIKHHFPGTAEEMRPETPSAPQMRPGRPRVRRADDRSHGTS
jgi:hypothetical protein